MQHSPPLLRLGLVMHSSLHLQDWNCKLQCIAHPEGLNVSTLINLSGFGLHCVVPPLPRACIASPPPWDVAEWFSTKPGHGCGRVVQHETRACTKISAVQLRVLMCRFSGRAYLWVRGDSVSVASWSPMTMGVSQARTTCVTLASPHRFRRAVG